MKDLFSKLKFTLCIDGEEVDGSAFGLQCVADRPDELCVYEGQWQRYAFRVEIARTGGMTAVCAMLEKDGPVNCRWIRADLTWMDTGLAGALVPGGGRNVGIAGMRPLEERPTPEDSRFCGFFKGSREACLLLGTKIPQDNLHLYSAKLLDENTALFSAVTYFTTGQARQDWVQTETTLVCAGLTPLKAMQRYAEHVEMLPPEKFAEPLVGWSTWDYYFTAIEPADLTENLDAIASDPELSAGMKCFMVDDGWQHREGEWFANYRFPKGSAGIAEEIRARGLVPGIWTNGCQTHTLTHTALRHGEMLLRDDDGNAIGVDGLLLIDPTHPAGEEYIFSTYRRLYEEGFRIFKVDFVGNLAFGNNFYDPGCGPYEAIRRLFRIIRRAVGEESHILGCSYPAECGAGIVDSSRISVDIHNYWSHVKWVLDYLQMCFWENGRLFRIDPDYLVVRGSETSTEEETNVTNFAPNPAFREHAPGNRWRRGAVFDGIEAETWANIVSIAGGNVVSSDRLNALNEAGMALLKRSLVPGSGAVPLDLGAARASLWYSEADGRLLVINQEEDAKEISVDLSLYGLECCAAECEKPFVYEDGIVRVHLRRHESAVIGLK